MESHEAVLLALDVVKALPGLSVGVLRMIFATRWGVIHAGIFVADLFAAGVLAELNGRIYLSEFGEHLRAWLPNMADDMREVAGDC